MEISEHISKLVANLGYPVTFKNMDKTGLAGIWRPKSGANKYNSIEISESLDRHQKLATLLHEIGHSKCSERNCRCIIIADAEGEIHAYVYALQWLLEHKCRKTLRGEMQHIASNIDRPDIYGEAAKHIMATVLWEDCKRYTGKLSWLRRLSKWIG